MMPARFWLRYLWVGSTYRELTFPEADTDFDRLRQWWDAVVAHPAVAATIVCRERLISSYSNYADNKAASGEAKNTQAQTEAAASTCMPAAKLLAMLVIGFGLGAAACAARSRGK
jgi:hypothetical protein